MHTCTHVRTTRVDTNECNIVDTNECNIHIILAHTVFHTPSFTHDTHTHTHTHTPSRVVPLQYVKDVTIVALGGALIKKN